MSDFEALAFRNAPDATLILADRVVMRVNLMVESLFGYAPRELEGQSVRLLYPGPTDYDVIGGRAYRAMRDSPFYSDERFMRRKDGQIIWMQGRGRTLDRHEPSRLSVWTYRPAESLGVGGGILTQTEMRVAKYLVNGFTSKEIAQALGCSHRTIEVHRANMNRKMQVRNSSELVSKLLNSDAGAKAVPPVPRALMPLDEGDLTPER